MSRKGWNFSYVVISVIYCIVAVSTLVVKIFMGYAATLSIDVNSKDNSNRTAFHLACMEGHSGVVKIFMGYAANLSIDIYSKDTCNRTHSMLNLTWMPIKVLWANSMLVGIKKSWGIFPIIQKSNTMTAFVDSENC